MHTPFHSAMASFTRYTARILAMCAFYAAQWKERIIVFVVRGDFRSAELVAGIGMFSTGETKLDLITDALVHTPLGLTYKVTGIFDIVCSLLVIGAVLWSHGKNGNIFFRSVVNLIAFCLWFITACIYWMGFEEKMFAVQQAMWADHFKAILVMLIIHALDLINIAANSGREWEGEHG